VVAGGEEPQRSGHQESTEERASRECRETVRIAEALWRLAKWARNKYSQAPEITPSLEDPNTAQMASGPADRAEVFRKTFFPSPPEAEIGDIEDATYPDRIAMPPITEQEVERALQEAAPLKGPAPTASQIEHCSWRQRGSRPT
jgi:hypothetical protein